MQSARASTTHGRNTTAHASHGSSLHPAALPAQRPSTCSLGGGGLAEVPTRVGEQPTPGLKERFSPTTLRSLLSNFLRVTEMQSERFPFPLSPLWQVMAGLRAGGAPTGHGASWTRRPPDFTPTSSPSTSDSTFTTTNTKTRLLVKPQPARLAADSRRFSQRGCIWGPRRTPRPGRGRCPSTRAVLQGQHPGWRRGWSARSIPRGPARGGPTLPSPRRARLAQPEPPRDAGEWVPGSRGQFPPAHSRPLRWTPQAAPLRLPFRLPLRPLPSGFPSGRPLRLPPQADPSSRSSQASPSGRPPQAALLRLPPQVAPSGRSSPAAHQAAAPRRP